LVRLQAHAAADKGVLSGARERVAKKTKALAECNADRSWPRATNLPICACAVPRRYHPRRGRCSIISPRRREFGGPIAVRHLRGPVSLTGGQSQASIFNDPGAWLQCARREKWSPNRLPRTGLSTSAAFRGPGRRWCLRQGLWLVAKEGLVPIRGQSPALASAQKIAGSV
jgi:hypothetical protein